MNISSKKSQVLYDTLVNDCLRKFGSTQNAINAASEQLGLVSENSMFVELGLGIDILLKSLFSLLSTEKGERVKIPSI